MREILSVPGKLNERRDFHCASDSLDGVLVLCSHCLGQFQVVARLLVGRVQHQYLVITVLSLHLIPSALFLQKPSGSAHYSE